VRNQWYAKADGVASDECVHGGNGLTFFLQFSADHPASMGGFFIERGDDEVEQEYFEQCDVGLASAPFLRTAAEFKCHDAG
jgi:hypothetical protein